MDPLRSAATALAVNRIAFGAGMVAVPAVAGRTWIGAHASDDRAQVLARALGVRDLAVGLGGLLSLRSGDAKRIRSWFGLQTATDSVDLAATLAAGSRMPAAGRAFAATAAVASIAVAAATAARAGR